MYVQDLYAILHAHWAFCRKARHGRFRVQIDTVFLMCAVTSTHPQALIESSSARGTNKALCYRHIQLWRVRDKLKQDRTTTIAIVTLVHIKGGGTKYVSFFCLTLRRLIYSRKEFVFHLENVLAFCIVSRLIAHALADNAFRRRYTSPEDIFNIKIRPNREYVKLKFRDKIPNVPIFRDIQRIGSQL